MGGIVKELSLQATCEAIVSPADPKLEAAVRQRLDALTKPPGSLGRLEEIALWYALAVGEALPQMPRSSLCVFCADHGVAAEGVSAYPSDVTKLMASNFAAGGAAINVLCRQGGVDATIVDVGVDSDSFPAPIRDEKIGRGTRNILHEPAMTPEQTKRAVEVGIRYAAEAVEAGSTLLAAGEMGIGNTTAASAVGAALSGLPPLEVVGRGTGVSESAWRSKVGVVTRALEGRRPDQSDALDVLAQVGGFEIAAMTGYYLGAAARRAPCVVDGFIATAAALAAVRLAPHCRPYLLFAHQSAERGHRFLLEAMRAEPLLSFGMRLGEGTGAAVAMGVVSQSVALYREMATFESAGIPTD